MLNQADATANPLNRKQSLSTVSDPLWATLDLGSRKTWESVETQNVLCNAIVNISYADILEGVVGEKSFDKVWNAEILPFVTALRTLMAPVAPPTDRVSAADLDTVKQELQAYKRGPAKDRPSTSSEVGSEWVQENCATLARFLDKHFDHYVLDPSVSNSTTRYLEHDVVREMLMPFFGYMAEADKEAVAIRQEIEVFVACTKRHLVEAAVANMQTWLHKNAKQREKVDFNVQVSERFVANADETSTTCGLCPHITSHSVTDPATGEMAPFVIDSPCWVEKIVLKKGVRIPDRMTPRYRAALSFSDLSDTPWGKSAAAKEKVCLSLQNAGLRQEWQHERRMMPLSLHKSRKPAIEALCGGADINSKEALSGSGKDGPCTSEGTADRWVEEGLLSMEVGEVAILRTTPAGSTTVGESKFVQVRNEGFVEEECGNDCCGCEEGTILLSSLGDAVASKAGGVGSYQAMKICGVVCTCHSCKACIKCLLTTAAMCVGFAVVANDAATN